MDSDVEEIESTSVTSVISTKCEKYIRALHLLGAKVNAQDSHGCTPLHTAAKTNNVIAAEVLLRFAETRPSIEDAKGPTPMDWAVSMVMARLSKLCVAGARRIRKIGRPSYARNMSLGRLKVKTNRKPTDGPLLRCESYLLC